MEEFYEELPGDQEDYPEDLYEDLPANDINFPEDAQPYNPNMPGIGGSPPPLPTGPIPTHRPGGPPPSQPAPPPPPPTQVSPPPLPTRAPSTALSSSPGVPGNTRTLQPQSKKSKADTKKKGATIARSSGGGGTGGGGGGIDMNEILKKARSRGVKSIEHLEHKRQQRDETDEDKHAAPWLLQLRKTAPASPKPKPFNEPEVNGTADDDVPEFIRKARTLSVTVDSDDETGHIRKPMSPMTARKPPPTTAKPPPVTAKPRLPTPGMAVDQTHPEVQEKPAWMKQRERQVNMAKMSSDTARPPPAPKPPVSIPNGHPPPAKKPRPVPAPRTVTSPKKEALVNEKLEQQASSLITPGGSVKDRAKSLERRMSGSMSPPTSPKAQHPKPPPPTRTTPVHQPSGNASTAAAPAIPSKPALSSKPPPAPPVRKEFKEPPAPPPALSPSPTPPPIPSKGGVLPPPPPAWAPPPPSMDPPAPPTTVPPPPTTARLPPTTPPPPPSTAPPTTFPTTKGEPTPPMVSVQKFRRLPLQFVDVTCPPAIPSRSSKPSIAIHEEDIEEDIYDDTLPGGDDLINGIDEGEELYDDLAESAKPPPPMTPPPSSRPPPPPFSAPPEVPPPLPSGPPPSILLSPGKIPPTESDDEIPTMDEEQETYEDVSVTTAEGGGLYPASSPSHPSLLPPSPQHSTSAPASPTLQRNKQKLSKEERRLQDEEKKKEKERKKLEKEREKEKKRKDEIRMKNRAKGIKVFKQYPLRLDMQHLFTVEVLLEHPKTKDHLPVSIGEVLFVLLLAHEKLPDGKYLAEKEDGTIGYVGKNITQRTAYQSAQSTLNGDQSSPGVGGPVPDSFIDEDIYESLPQDEVENGAVPLPMGSGTIPPNLPPPNAPNRFPPPAHAPPPPPGDEPEELYEELPEDAEGGF